MPQDDDIKFKLGELSGRMTSTENKVNSLENTINGIDVKLDNIQADLNKGKGSWKTITVVGAIIVAILSTGSDLIAKIFHLS